MTAVLEPTVEDKLRQAVEEAARAGLPTPGRRTLMKETGASDWTARRFLKRLDSTLPPPASRSETPGDSTDTTPPPTANPATEEPEPTPPPWTGKPPDTTLAGGHLVAWVGFVFGSIMSVAANVLHTWLPASHHQPGWSPGLAPQIGAAVWPIALLISVEVLSRVQWKTGFLWNMARYLGAGTVAIGSGVISYGHLREVLLAWGYGHPGADVGPLVLDGLMVVSGFALLSMGGQRGGRKR